MNNKNTVVIVTGVFKPEPIVSASLMADLAAELSKKYNVVVLHPKPTRPLGFKMPDFNYDALPYKVIQLDSYTCPESSFIGRFKESISFGNVCAKYIDEHYEEICMIYNAPWHLFGRKTVAKRALKYGIPYVTPVQDIFPESIIYRIPTSFFRSIAKSILLPIDKFALQNADLIHTISPKMVDYLSPTRNVEREKFVVVRNWQDEKSFTAFKEKITDTGNEDKVFTFMYLGNIGPLAGVETLFEALKLSELHNARIVVAGSGSAKESLKKLASEQYHDCNIEFWDVPDGKVPATQAKADVMCLPVKIGGAEFSIPSKLPAYMFSEKPIIASVDLDCDTAMCVRESDCGWVVEPESPQAISKAMIEAFNTSNDELKQKGLRGFYFAIENLSRTKNLDKLTNACLSIIKK